MESKRMAKSWESIDFTIYFSFVKWPVVLLLVLEIIFRIWSNNLGTGLLYNQQEIIAWVLRIVVFAFLGWRVLKNYGDSAAIAAVAGAIAGFINGFIISFYRFFEGVRFWKFVNILTETTLVTIVGILTAILVLYIFSLKSD